MYFFNNSLSLNKKKMILASSKFFKYLLMFGNKQTAVVFCHYFCSQHNIYSLYCSRELVGYYYPTNICIVYSNHTFGRMKLLFFDLKIIELWKFFARLTLILRAPFDKNHHNSTRLFFRLLTAIYHAHDHLRCIVQTFVQPKHIVAESQKHPLHQVFTTISVILVSVIPFQSF